ncbi:hypothetical protein SBRCBS47491_004752 [Sporothrix bragantina]|uniref:Bromo domain-containing protein n=1 Tax=Sporothrix bragantina TaxID=671064 RepID=A0ABP0BRM3_9PEZI
MTSSSSSFTPLESLLLFQSILKHGVEPEAFARIASVLQANPFVRSDDRYNAERLTADSLRGLFLEEVGADKVDASALPPLIERLYVRYRDHIVGAIREDERRIEKVQGEIRLLEQQAAGGGGRGARAAEARAAEAKAAAGRQLQLQQQQQQQQQLQQQQLQLQQQQHQQQQQQQAQQQATATASPLLGKNAGSAGSAASSRSTSVSASARPASSTPELHAASIQRGASAAVPLLPATARPDAAASSASTPGRIVASPALQQQQQQQQQGRTVPQLAPLPPAASASSQPPTRAASTASTQLPPNDPKLLAATPAGQPTGVSSQPASRSISPAQPSSLPLPPQQQQKQAAGAPPLLKTSQLPTKSATPPNLTPTTQTSIPNSPSTVAAAQQNAQAAQPPTGPAAAGRVETPRPLVPAAQKLMPIAPVPLAPNQNQVQRAPPTGAPSTPGPQSAAGASLVPRPPLPEHVRGGPPSRTPTPVQSPRPLFPHTPVAAASAAMFLPRGSGTRWKPSDPTPSTPGPDVGDMASPAYEPLSPVQPASRTVDAAEDDADDDEDDASAASPSATTRRTLRNQPLKPVKTDRNIRGRPLRATRHSSVDDDVAHPIKAEASSPKPIDEDVEEEEEEVSRKRKRGESVLARRRLVGPPTPPTHVLWMRGFPKISASALDQISSHRHANMFAHKIRDRDAPGYGSIVRHPVDLKSIRMAITQGNKAASAASAALGESEGNSVWLPISADLVPPRGIINSSQLECELVHMFANAVMYNPDSHRGVGPAFLVEDDVADDDDPSSNANPDTSSSNVRYQVDEDGVVNDTRAMYVEVEKLLSEMRSAERQRGMPPPPSGAKGLDLRLEETEAADGGHGDDEDTKEAKEDEDADEGGTSKRRRITRGQ